jgi:hypothetical protein
MKEKVTEIYVVCDSYGLIQDHEIYHNNSGVRPVSFFEKTVPNLLLAGEYTVRLITWSGYLPKFQEQCYGQHWQSVDLISRKIKEAEEVEELIAQCEFIHKKKDGWYQLDRESGKWCISAEHEIDDYCNMAFIKDSCHPTLHAALTALTSGEHHA